jgi:hypothetical protein
MQFVAGSHCRQRGAIFTSFEGLPLLLNDTEEKNQSVKNMGCLRLCFDSPLSLTAESRFSDILNTNNPAHD